MLATMHLRLCFTSKVSFNHVSKTQGFHTARLLLFNKFKANDPFRKLAWSGDADFKGLTTDYLMNKYPKNEMGHLNCVRDIMVSKVVHSRLAREFPSSNSSQKPDYHDFRIFLKSFVDANGYTATKEVFNNDIGPKAEEMANYEIKTKAEKRAKHEVKTKVEEMAKCEGNTRAEKMAEYEGNNKRDKLRKPKDLKGERVIRGMIRTILIIFVFLYTYKLLRRSHPED